MGVPGCDPWVQLTDKCSENVESEEKRKGQWKRKFGNPAAARSSTFGRLGAGSQRDAEMHKFCEPTGMIRPGVDPLPHHYGLSQNHKLLRANLRQHIDAFSVPTKPKSSYDPIRDTSYMSPCETTDKDPDFMYRTANRLFNTEKYLPSRERKARVHARAAATLRELPSDFDPRRTPPMTGASGRSGRGPRHVFMGEDLVSTQLGLKSQLDEVMRELEAVGPGSTGPTPRSRGMLSSRSHVKGMLIKPPHRVGPFASPDRNPITVKDGEAWKRRFDTVMDTAAGLLKKRQEESRRSIADGETPLGTPTRDLDTPPHHHGDSLLPMC